MASPGLLSPGTVTDSVTLFSSKTDDAFYSSFLIGDDLLVIVSSPLPPYPPSKWSFLQYSLQNSAAKKKFEFHQGLTRWMVSPGGLRPPGSPPSDATARVSLATAATETYTSSVPAARSKPIFLIWLLTFSRFRLQLFVFLYCTYVLVL